MQGPQGEASPVGTWKGLYNAGTTYALNAIVQDGGSTWISLQAGNTGHTPASSSAWWDLVLSKGDKGDKGATGAPGTTAVVQISKTVAGDPDPFTSSDPQRSELSCDPGQRVISGGVWPVDLVGHDVPPPETLAVMWSSAVSETTWAVGWYLQLLDGATVQMRIMCSVLAGP